VRIDDPAAVARRYATEANLEASLDAVREVRPDHVLGVGRGTRLLAARPGELPACDLPLRIRRASSVCVAEQAG